jgi:hypothetical protein
MRREEKSLAKFEQLFADGGDLTADEGHLTEQNTTWPISVMARKFPPPQERPVFLP